MRETIKQKQPFLEQLSERMDTVIGFFSPKAAFNRKMFRYASSYAFKSYRGAERDRLRDSWIPGGGSADSDLLYELEDLRERSRDLNRNDGVAAGITDTLVTNVVGSGIQLQSRIDKDALSLSDTELEKFQKDAERAFKRWSSFADASEKLDFIEMQQLVDRQILENGEVIILPIRKEKRNSPYSLSFQVIEADRLGTPAEKQADRKVRSGVHIGDHGEPIGYWIRKTHPGDDSFGISHRTADQYQYIPAKDKNGNQNILHLYWMKRPGQTRGVPFFTPVLTKFKDLSEYMEAELVAARIAACFALFVQKTDPLNSANLRANRSNAKGQRIESLEPGMIEYLAEGETISTFSPNRPGQTFDSFVERILRMMGAALGLPYELVAKDFSKTNYSSARAALLQAYRYFRTRQEWIAKKFCQPVYEMVMEEAFLKGDLGIKSFYSLRHEWTRARWIAPGWAWVDPLKEVKAAKEAVDGNLSSLADEAAAQGKDWEEIIEQRKREEDKKEKLGLITDPDPEDVDSPQVEDITERSRSAARSKVGLIQEEKARIDGELKQRIREAIREKARIKSAS